MKLKKSIAVFLSTLLLLSVVFSTTTLAYDTTQDFTYQRIGTTTMAEITGITAGSQIESNTTITVPSSIGGYLITTIGTKAFANGTVQEEIILPNTITHISNLAFYNSKALKTVTIPLNVQTIDTRAFSYCPNLETVNFNTNNLQIISKAMFYNSTSLNNVIIPTSVNTIESMAFSRCTSLERIYIPSNVAVIEDDAFLYSDNVTIYGTTHSPVHYYALEKGIPFVELSSRKDMITLNNWLIATQYELSDDTSIYTPETLQNLLTVYEEANAIKNDFFSTQAQVDTVATKLSTAFNSLKLKVMLELEATLSVAKTYTNDTNLYTQQSFDELQAVITSAQVLIKESSPNFAEVEAMLQLLNDKIDGLLLQSKADLQTLVDTANNIVNTSDIYTETTIADLTTAIANATAVLSDKSSTDEIFKSEFEALNSKINALHLISFDTLTNNVAEIELELTNNAHKYTPESIKVVQDELDSAKALLNTSNPTNDELVAQNESLTTAFKSLTLVTLGDVNSDGELSVIDVILILRNIVDMVQFDDRQQFISDVNSDGSITVLDAVMLQNQIINS